MFLSVLTTAVVSLSDGFSPCYFIPVYYLHQYFLLHWGDCRSHDCWWGDAAAFGVLVHCRTINKLTCSVLDWAKSYHLSWQRSCLDANRDPEIRRIVQMNQPLCTHLKADEGRQRCVVVVATETDFCTWQPWAVLWLVAIGRSMASRFAPMLTLSPSSTK